LLNSDRCLLGLLLGLDLFGLDLVDLDLVDLDLVDLDLVDLDLVDLDLIALDSMDHSKALSLSCHFIQLSLALEADLDLSRHILKVNKHTLLLGVAILQSHLLDLDLATGDLILTEEDGKGNAVDFSGLELGRNLGLNLVEEFGLNDKC
jgi:hypothetical protein